MNRQRAVTEHRSSLLLILLCFLFMFPGIDGLAAPLRFPALYSTGDGPVGVFFQQLYRKGLEKEPSLRSRFPEDESFLFLPGRALLKESSLDLLSMNGDEEAILPSWISSAPEEQRELAALLLNLLPASASFYRTEAELPLLMISGNFPKSPGGRNWEQVELISPDMISSNLLDYRESKVDSPGPLPIKLISGSYSVITMARLGILPMESGKKSIQPGEEIPLSIRSGGITIQFRGRVEAVDKTGSVKVRSLSPLFTDNRGRRTFEKVYQQDNEWIIRNEE